MKTFFLLLITSVILSSCYNTLLPFRIPTSNPKLPETNTTKEIPTYSNGKYYVFYKYAKQKQNQLHISSPEYGTDSLMIRLWFSYPENIYQYGELVEILFKPNEIPVAKYSKLNLFFNPTRDYEVINKHKDSIIKKPVNGWNNISTKINELNILNLPTIENLTTYKIQNNNQRDYNNTSLTVSVEISSKSNYRFYQYNNFEKYKSIKEVNDLYTFIKLLRTELAMSSIDENWYKE